MKTQKLEVLDTTDPRFVRRLAKAINRECALNGFYSSYGIAPETGGSRKFHGHVEVVKGRLMAREVAGDTDQCTIDLTGVEVVHGNGNGPVGASRYLKYPSA